MQLDVSVAFFLLGAFAAFVRSDIAFPKGLYQSLVLYLMIAIGLKGGIALSAHASWDLVTQSIFVISLGLVLPLIAFPILYYVGKLPRQDAASICAHYGSVSVGTYAVAVAFLEAMSIEYEDYIALFVVLLEMPAIAVGIALAKRAAAKGESSGGPSLPSGKLLHEIFLNQGIVLMTGGLLIGYMAGERTYSIAPLFFDLFNGVLALFLLEMGMVSARRIGELKHQGSFMLAFGIFMPLIGGVMGSALGLAVGLSTGGAILLAVLGGSASYIAVPAVMRQALPDSNHSLSIGVSLGITFPFNVILGIPTYMVITQWFAA
ncbi:MAG: sodium-dependent bicarbonate transport family permease [Halioglobus sp.]